MRVFTKKYPAGILTNTVLDNFTEAELIFTALAELSTRQIAENMQTTGLEKNKIPAKKGGRIAKNARLELEQKTNKKIVSSDNFKIPQGKKYQELE